MARHNVVRDGHVHALTVGDDAALLVAGEGVIRNRAASAAREKERAEIDRDTVLSPVQRILADVMDVAVGDARRRAAAIAIDEDPEIVRSEYLGGINGSVDAVNVHANIATRGVDRPGDCGCGIDHGSGHVNAVSHETGWGAGYRVEADGC